MTNPEETGLGDRDEAGQRLEPGAGGKAAEGPQRLIYPCEAVDAGPVTRAPRFRRLDHGLVLRLRADADGEADR